MANSCCNIVYNSEVIINEMHSNNFAFVLDNIPVSYLMSKFNNEKCMKSVNPSDRDAEMFRNMESIKEFNNDVRNLALFTQKTTIPGVKIHVNDLALSSTANVKVAGGKMSFDELSTTFQVDENFFIPRFFYHWLTAAANPEEIMKFNQHEYLANFYTNGHLLLLDNNRDKTVEIMFEGLHPISVSPIELNSDEPNKVFITISWLYTSYVFADEYKTVYGKV